MNKKSLLFLLGAFIVLNVITDCLFAYELHKMTMAFKSIQKHMVCFTYTPDKNDNTDAEADDDIHFS